ncbi:hypothetical protein ABKT64_22040, partial [Enterobacter roggenkampii]|uniref:hypothetical protein n=1 Tax=Enterobacter roggenkampii TaxID=1812935 RepID=UPI0032AE94EE
IFLFNIIIIDGDQLVKSEQSTLHLSAFLACFRQPSPQYDGYEGGDKKFFWVLLFTLFTFSFLSKISKGYRVNIR